MSKLAITLATLSLSVLAAVPAAAQTGYIKCSGNVGRAGIFVDGKYIGPVARFTVGEKYAVPAGSHEVVLKDPRYEDFSTTVTVTEGETTKVSFNMKKKEVPRGPFGRFRFGGGHPDSFMSIVGGDTSAVYINGVFWGYVDEFNNSGSGALLVPGSYEITVDSPTYGQINEKVTIEANRVTVIPLKW